MGINGEAFLETGATKFGAGQEEEVVEDHDDLAVLCDCTFSLAYGNRVLLHNTKLKLKRGKCYGLIGPNGAGKSTLMRSIAAGVVEGFPKKFDAFGNKIVIKKAELKKIKKQVAALRKQGQEVYTDEEVEKAGYTI